MTNELGPPSKRESIVVKALSVEEREFRERVNEDRLNDLQIAFDNNLAQVLKTIADSENPKQEFGRSLPGKLFGSAAKYLIEKERLALEREKLAWAQKVWREKQSGAFEDDIAKGISVTINVEGTRGDAGGGTQSFTDIPTN